MDDETNIPGLGPMSSEQIDQELAPTSDDDQMMTDMIPSSILDDPDEQMELQSDVVNLRELEEGISDVKGTSNGNSNVRVDDVKVTSPSNIPEAMETELACSEVGKEPTVLQQNQDSEEIVEINVSQADLFDDCPEVVFSSAPKPAKTFQEIRKVHKPVFKSGPVTTRPSSTNTNRPRTYGAPTGKRIIIADSNLDKCWNHIKDVVYQRAIRFEVGSDNFVNKMNKLRSNTEVQKVVVSTLLNEVHDALFINWMSTVDKFVQKITEVATEMHWVRFYIVAPFRRTSHPEHVDLLIPIICRLQTGLRPLLHRNVSVETGFKVAPDDLVGDGVHLRKESHLRLLQFVARLLDKPWVSKPPKDFTQKATTGKEPVKRSTPPRSPTPVNYCEKDLIEIPIPQHVPAEEHSLDDVRIVHESLAQTERHRLTERPRRFPSPRQSNSQHEEGIKTRYERSPLPRKKRSPSPRERRSRHRTPTPPRRSRRRTPTPPRSSRRRTPTPSRRSRRQTPSPPHRSRYPKTPSRERSRRFSPSPKRRYGSRHWVSDTEKHKECYYQDYRDNRSHVPQNSTKQTEKFDKSCKGQDEEAITVAPRRIISETEPVVTFVPNFASTSAKIANKFSGRLGPIVEQAGSPRPSTSTGKGFVPDGFLSEDSDDCFGITVGEQNDDKHEQTVEHNPGFDFQRLGKLSKSQKPDKGSRAFVVADRHAQELCCLRVQDNFLASFCKCQNKELEEQEFRMPRLTFHECQQMTTPFSTLASRTFDRHRIRIFRTDLDEMNSDFARRMIANFHKYRLIFPDTEGDFLLDKFDGTGKRLFVSIGDFEGNVYLFLDGDDIPEEFRRILEDWRYAKVQSAICKDMQLFLKLCKPIHVRGWVDTQTLFMAFIHPNAEHTKAESILQRFGQEYQRWTLRHWEFNKLFGTPNLSEKAIMHSAQDSRLPALVLLRAVELYARRLEFRPSDDVFPLVRLALDLTRHVSKDNLANHLFPDPSQNWRPPLRLTKGEPNEFGLNDCLTVTYIRMAQDDVIETSFTRGREPTFKQLTETAIRLWGENELPRHKLVVSRNEVIDKELRKHCNNCGKNDHRIQKCPNYRSFQHCEYDHAERQFPKHSILMCPVLHHVCSDCQTRGHLESHHHKWDPVKMYSEFQTRQHLGLFTSIPFLSLVPEHQHRVLFYHWIMGFQHRNLESCPGNAYRIGNFTPELHYREVEAGATHMLRETSSEERKAYDRTRLRQTEERRQLMISIARHNLTVEDEKYFCPPRATAEEFEQVKQGWEHFKLAQEGR
jgi:hypothetical protein